LTDDLHDAALDLSVAPLTYPGPPIERSGVLRVSDGRFVAGPPAGLAGAPGRVPVVAVGSNASAGVLLWKLRQGGVGGELPLVRARVRNLRVVPSAHVGRPGFVPAAPAHVPGDTSAVVVGWFDREQLDCVDRTEPNYRRVRLSADDYPVELEFVVPLDAFAVYESNWGVLADAGVPLRLPDQPALAQWLAARGLAPWSELAPVDAVAALAGSIERRERARRDLRAAGLVTDSGLRIRWTPPDRPARLRADGA
jgi:hypothetical protein